MTNFPEVDWSTSDLQFKASSGQFNVDEAQGIVECFVAAVGNKDSVGDIVAQGAFDGSLRRRKPRVVWGHDWNQPIGKVLAIEEVGANDPRLPMKMKQAGVGGLLARVQFNLRSERGREAFASVAFFGEDQEWSIGYKTIKAQYNPEMQANVLQEVELFEVSPVLHGANQLTGTISVKSADEDRVDSFQKSKWPMFDRSYAASLKENHPDIWSKGGNIKGNDQYEILTKIAAQGGKATTEDQIKALELREAWIARHHGDFRLPGIIAQIKWLAIGSRGEDHMKKVIKDAVSRKSTKGHAYGYEPEEEAAPIRKRVMMLRDGRGLMKIQAGPEKYEARENDDNGTYIDRNAGLGPALAATVRAPIQLQMVRENFAIFSMPDDYGDEDDYFVSYHFDKGNNRYMFSEPMEIEMETVVRFDDDDHPYAKAYDMAAGFADIEQKQIGAAIGGTQANPNETVDHDGDGVIFDGTPNEQRAPRKRQNSQNASPRGGRTRQSAWDAVPPQPRGGQRGQGGRQGGRTRPAIGEPGWRRGIEHGQDGDPRYGNVNKPAASRPKQPNTSSGMSRADRQRQIDATGRFLRRVEFNDPEAQRAMGPAKRQNRATQILRDEAAGGRRQEVAQFLEAAQENDRAKRRAERRRAERARAKLENIRDNGSVAKREAVGRYLRRVQFNERYGSENLTPQQQREIQRQNRTTWDTTPQSLARQALSEQVVRDAAFGGRKRQVGRYLRAAEQNDRRARIEARRRAERARAKLENIRDNGSDARREATGRFLRRAEFDDMYGDKPARPRDGERLARGAANPWEANAAGERLQRQQRARRILQDQLDSGESSRRDMREFLEAAERNDKRTVANRRRDRRNAVRQLRDVAGPIQPRRSWPYSRSEEEANQAFGRPRNEEFGWSGSGIRIPSPSVPGSRTDRATSDGRGGGDFYQPNNADGRGGYSAARRDRGRATRKSHEDAFELEIKMATDYALGFIDEYEYKTYDIAASANDIEFKDIDGNPFDNIPFERPRRLPSIGGGGRGRGGRRPGRGAGEPFDPNAEDGDGDGLVQDDSPLWRRPARPRLKPGKPGDLLTQRSAPTEEGTARVARSSDYDLLAGRIGDEGDGPDIAEEAADAADALDPFDAVIGAEGTANKGETFTTADLPIVNESSAGAQRYKNAVAAAKAQLAKVDDTPESDPETFDLLVAKELGIDPKDLAIYKNTYDAVKKVRTALHDDATLRTTINRPVDDIADGAGKPGKKVADGIAALDAKAEELRKRRAELVAALKIDNLPEKPKGDKVDLTAPWTRNKVQEIAQVDLQLRRVAERRAEFASLKDKGIDTFGAKRVIAPERPVVRRMADKRLELVLPDGTRTTDPERVREAVLDARRSISEAQQAYEQASQELRDFRSMMEERASVNPGFRATPEYEEMRTGRLKRLEAARNEARAHLDSVNKDQKETATRGLPGEQPTVDPVSEQWQRSIRVAPARARESQAGTKPAVAEARNAVEVRQEQRRLSVAESARRSAVAEMALEAIKRRQARPEARRTVKKADPAALPNWERLDAIDADLREMQGRIDAILAMDPAEFAASADEQRAKIKEIQQQLDALNDEKSNIIGAFVQSWVHSGDSRDGTSNLERLIISKLNKKMLARSGRLSTQEERENALDAALKDILTKLGNYDATGQLRSAEDPTFTRGKGQFDNEGGVFGFLGGVTDTVVGNIDRIVSDDESSKRVAEKKMLQERRELYSGKRAGLIAKARKAQSEAEWQDILQKRRRAVKDRLTPGSMPIAETAEERGSREAAKLDTVARNEHVLALIDSIPQNREDAIKYMEQQLKNAEAQANVSEAKRLQARRLRKEKELAKRRTRLERQHADKTEEEIASIIADDAKMEMLRDDIAGISEVINEKFGDATILVRGVKTKKPVYENDEPGARVIRYDEGIDDIEVNVAGLLNGQVDVETLRAIDKIAEASVANVRDRMRSRRAAIRDEVLQAMPDASAEAVAAKVAERLDADVEMKKLETEMARAVEDSDKRWILDLVEGRRRSTPGSKGKAKPSPNEGEGPDLEESIARSGRTQEADISGLGAEAGRVAAGAQELAGIGETLGLPPNASIEREDVQALMGLLRLPERNGGISQRARKMIEMAYGLTEEYPSRMTYAEIADALGVSQSDVQRTIKASFNELKKLFVEMYPNSQLVRDIQSGSRKSLWHRSTEFSTMQFKAIFERFVVPTIRGEMVMYDDYEYGFKAVSPTEIPLNPSNAVPDVLPQERVTGDILRGYGPRRGNLERLLRYWRPIMRREGGFRRCRVILADHPELYPLEPLCAWLHHETTGLWPNEGCHHPGMKNCRRKIKKVVRGSLFSDAEFNDRLQRLTSGKLNVRVPGGKLPNVPGKSAEESWPDDEMDMKGPGMGVSAPDLTDEDIAALSEKGLMNMGIHALKEFMVNEPEWVDYLRDDDNWEHVGDDSYGYVVPHPMMMPSHQGGSAHGGGSCGCGGSCGGSCGCGGGMKSLGGNLIEEIETEIKAGRTLSARNVSRVKQAIDALQQILKETGNGMDAKGYGDSDMILAAPEELFELKQFLDPVLEFHGVDATVVEDGIIIKSIDSLSQNAIDALVQSVNNFDS